jgi:hypothetical protein
MTVFSISQIRCTYLCCFDLIHLLYTRIRVFWCIEKCYSSSVAKVTQLVRYIILQISAKVSQKHEKHDTQVYKHFCEHTHRLIPVVQYIAHKMHHSHFLVTSHSVSVWHSSVPTSTVFGPKWHHIFSACLFDIFIYILILYIACTHACASFAPSRLLIACL